MLKTWRDETVSRLPITQQFSHLAQNDEIQEIRYTNFDFWILITWATIERFVKI